MEYTLTRKRNMKRIVLRVKDGVVCVSAPYHAKKADIDKFVESKQAWIEEQLAKLPQEKFVFDYSYKPFVKGQPLNINAREGMRIGYDDDGFYLPPNLDSETLKLNIEAIYKMLAKKICGEKLIHWSNIMGLSPANMTTTSANTRWGSCSKKKPPKPKKNPASMQALFKNLQAAIGEEYHTISFSWKLIMADDECIDSVVIHELAHMRHGNHSKEFYSEIYKYMSETTYKACEKRLNELTKKQLLEGWNI